MATTDSSGAFSVPVVVTRGVGVEAGSECEESNCEIKAEGGGVVVRANIAMRPDLQPLLTLSPNADLVPGQQVTLSGMGFYPGDTVLVYQCGDACVQLASPSVDETGAFTLPLTLQRFVDGHDCFVTSTECSLAAFAPANAFAGTKIHFRDYARPQPDLFVQIRCAGCGTLFDDVYDFFSQMKRPRTIQPGAKWSYALRVQNDGENEDDLMVKAIPVTGPFTVRYFVGPYDVTAAMTGDGFTFNDVAPGEVRRFAVQLKADTDAPSRASATAGMRVTSGLNPIIADTMSVGVRIAKQT